MSRTEHAVIVAKSTVTQLGGNETCFPPPLGRILLALIGGHVEVLSKNLILEGTYV